MKIYMIRHGATMGNLEHRYVGCTDEAITDEAAEELKKLRYVFAQSINNVEIYISPMLRCRQTADIIFPELDKTVIEEFRECSFGEFEYMNYEELDGDCNYQRFIDSGGCCGFPGGETREEFQGRCMKGFGKMLDMHVEERDIVMVVHGGTIMAVMDKYSALHKDYYDWRASNGRGFSMELSTDECGCIKLYNIEKI